MVKLLNYIAWFKQITFILFILLNIIINQNRINTQITWKTEASWPNLCQTGRRQSPIDIPTNPDFKFDNTQIIKFISSNYSLKSLPVNVKNEELFQVDISKSGYIIIEKNGIRYRYDGISMHFHIDSEHTLGGKKSDFEIQIVHLKNNDYLLAHEIYDDPDKENQRLVISIRVNANGTNKNLEFEKIN